LQGKANASDKELRTMKTQLEELTRTATDYTAMLKRKETEISQLLTNMDDLHVEREQSLKHTSELQAHTASLEEQLEVSTAERQREHAARNRLQKEIDDLRNVMAAKASEDTRKNEAHRSREKELTNLRAQHSKLGEQLEDVRRSNAESHARMKIELEEATHNRSALEQSQKELLAKQTDNLKRREAAEASLADSQRAQRSMESEIRVLKERSVKLEGELAETTKSKEVRDPIPFDS
jgi:myosin protein heavy chain